MKLTSIRLAILGAASLVGGAGSIAACGGDDTTTGTTPKDAGNDTTTVTDTGGGGSDTSPPPDTAPPPDAAGFDAGDASTSRGEYLVKHLLLCGGCHNQPGDGGAFLGGGRAFPIALADGGDGGAVYARNLTPDGTGLQGWTVQQIATAIRTGSALGRPLFPIMPYAIFGNLTEEDAFSIALYLQSLPATTNAVPPPTASVAQAAPVLDFSTIIPHTTLDGGGDASDFNAAERGRYLVGLGCFDCHTPRNGGARDLTKVLGGGRVFGAHQSDNLTPDPTGLAAWTNDDIVAALKTAQRPNDGGTICPPMPSKAGTFGGLTDGDLADLATYVHTLPPVANGPFDDGGACN